MQHTATRRWLITSGLWETFHFLVLGDSRSLHLESWVPSTVSRPLMNQSCEYLLLYCNYFNQISFIAASIWNITLAFILKTGNIYMYFFIQKSTTWQLPFFNFSVLKLIFSALPQITQHDFCNFSNLRLDVYFLHTWYSWDLWRLFTFSVYLDTR